MRRNPFPVLVSVVAATCAVAASNPGGGTEAPTLTGAARCPDARGFTCSTLTVPLDHGGRAKGSLRLRVATQDVSAPRGILVFLTGGPGQPGERFALRVASRLGAAVNGYRIVMFDQRGTGAGALRCPALQAQMGSSDLAVPTKAAVVACARAIGPKRRYFSTAQTVEDLDALRRALKVETLTLDGVSYGTFVAERYALRYPNRIARLVLDSVVPHEKLDPLSIAGAHATARVLRAVCAANGCTTDPAADLAAVVRRRPVGTALLDALVTMSVANPQFSGVAAALHSARRGSWGPLESLVERWGPDPATPYALFSQGLHTSALCADTVMPWGSANAPLARRAPALRRAVARVAAKAIWPFTRAIASGNGIVKTCEWWPPTPSPPQPRAKRLPPVPVLLLAGDRDLSTPLAWGKAELRAAPKGRLFVVRGAGHSTQLRAQTNSGRAALAAFLRGS